MSQSYLYNVSVVIFPYTYSFLRSLSLSLYRSLTLSQTHTLTHLLTSLSFLSVFLPLSLSPPLSLSNIHLIYNILPQITMHRTASYRKVIIKYEPLVDFAQCPLKIKIATFVSTKNNLSYFEQW